MAEFKEIVLTPEANFAWEQSPRVAARAAQLHSFAVHQKLSFSAESLSRMLQLNQALNATQGPLPTAHDFLPGRPLAVA